MCSMKIREILRNWAIIALPLLVSACASATPPPSPVKAEEVAPGRFFLVYDWDALDSHKDIHRLLDTRARQVCAGPYKPTSEDEPGFMLVRWDITCTGS